MLCLRVYEPVDGYHEECGYVTFDPYHVVYHGDQEWVERLLERTDLRDGSSLAKARHVARSVVGTGVRVELVDPPADTAESSDTVIGDVSDAEKSAKIQRGASFLKERRSSDGGRNEGASRRERSA